MGAVRPDRAARARVVVGSNGPTVDAVVRDCRHSWRQVRDRRISSRLRLIRQPRNLGGNAARNRGIRAAASPLVLFVDDEVLPVINGYWENAELPWPLFKRMGELGIVGDGIDGYGCPELSPLAVGVITMELNRGDGSLGTFSRTFSAIVGASRPEQVRDNAAAGDPRLVAASAPKPKSKPWYEKRALDWYLTVHSDGKVAKFIDKVEAPDATHVVFTCSKPKANMLGLWIPILPEHVWSKVSPKAAGASYQSKPPIIGTGPFQVAEVKKGDYVRMVANPTFWGQKPTIDEILFVTYQNPDTMTDDLIGAVMGKVLPQFKGRAEGSTINAIAREELGKQA